ncbi:MBL fold metallo-hydrolase [Gordonia sp. LSe1-13]|uniref:MBL fold metallo-hydrolase n=1 Tax=Gordonia sesuvii TaxID=3116777 RepID=A0ABU7M815_9ACTN|nr:MBL fold metallo-hydrolase [Gordonia sp. LSe1-13]
MTSSIDTTRGGLARRAASTLTSAGRSATESATTSLARRGLTSARALGAGAAEIATHTAGSPNLRDGAFGNLDHGASQVDADFSVVVDMARRPGRPRRPVPVLTPDFGDTVADLRVTWLGHASVLVEIDGMRVLTDPVLSRRCSPSQIVGPARMHPAPVTVAQLPPVDVVLISHDHYDHLDLATVVELAVTQPAARFVAPLGVGAHLAAWGVAPDRIESADWWDSVTVNGADGRSLTFTCCPARHFSGRSLSRNLTLWASWVVAGAERRLFFSGDTGFSEHFAEVGDRLGPVDASLMAVGAYDRAWPDVHVTPEEAVAVHQMITGDRESVLLPIHWGTFNLARHPWAEPITRLLPAAAATETPVVVPPPGGTIDLTDRTGPGLAHPLWWESSA